MKGKIEIWFWVTSFLILVVLFSESLSSWSLSFFFVSFLFPVIFGTSFYFNEVLVPKYLLTDRKTQFVTHFFYLLVISVYLEMLVMLVAFVVLADYQIEHLGEIAGDIRFLIIILYFVVFAFGFLQVFRKLKNREAQIERLEKRTKEERSILVTANRKKIKVPLSKIEFIESLSDYLKIQFEEDQLITRERITKMDQELGEDFLRVHRSFLVNKSKIQSFTAENVRVNNLNIPIGRKYRYEVRQALHPTST